MIIKKKNIGYGIYTISLEGDLDLYSSNEFKIFIDKIAKYQIRGLVIDLSSVVYIDSSGIGMLISIYTKANKSSWAICFCGPNGQVKNVLSLSRIDNILPIEPFGVEALRKVIPKIMLKKNKKVGGPIFVDSHNILFNKENMRFKSLHIDITRIRYISHLITQEAPKKLRNDILLEQQISEIIKNGVRHGNRNDISKKLDIWWYFKDEEARLIVEDEGDGFSNLEEWNEFYLKRLECFVNNDHERMAEFISYRGKDSHPDDGGNALFAAVEYWNKGYVLNNSRNGVAVKKTFS